jgi:hypothetical protein
MTVWRNLSSGVGGRSQSQGQSGEAVDDGPLYNSTARSLGFSPAHLRFPHQEVGTTSDPQSVEMSNLGTRTITLQQISVWGDFTQTNDCGKTLAAGQSCFITVSFGPTGAGFRKGGVRVSTNAPDSPQISVHGGIVGMKSVLRERDFTGMDNGSSMKTRIPAEAGGGTSPM